MMTFKEFYQRSSKGAKAPLRPWTSSKTHKTPNRILDRIKKLKAVKVGLASAHKHQHVRNYRLTRHVADVAETTQSNPDRSCWGFDPSFD